ncbi:MAG TPA: 23S rRNA (uracil(1939)-C(5))-methyltransferase RlmD [Clostridiales bacterium]|nr:23S rRNA (uracil(1939)-C(5))-methyltransferase RlmD [Clostridiales bacterium]
MIYHCCMITKNMDLEVTIIDMGINGEGIAKHDGAVIFVPFALKDEVVKIHIIYAKSHYYVGKILEILKPSPFRVKPICPYFQKCGGCDLQHLDNAKILEFKTDLVKNSLRNIAKINADGVVHNCIGLNEYYYRNKFAFPIGQHDNEKFVGMYKENSHNIIRIDNCYIQADWSKKVIDIFNHFLNTTNNSVYEESTRTGLIKHLVCRMENNQLLVCVVINGKQLNDMQVLINYLSQEFENFGLMVNHNTLNNNVILTNNYTHIYGIKTISISSHNINYEVSLNSFMQVNTPIADAIYSKVQELVSGETVVNAFSGAGLLSAYIAKTAKQVYGIEIVESSHNDAEKLKVNNSIINLTNILGDVAKELPKINHFDCIVLDPPRKGCSRIVLDTILNVAPEKIIYVSCDPATLSRDIGILKDKYQLEFAQPYDMFPKTRHTETLAYLTKKDI